MVDIHSHILPEVDDGAASWEVAVAMCKMAAAQGTEVMVATPHANDEYSYDRAAHRATLARLQELVGPAPHLMLGCDFHFSYDNFQAAMANPENFVIGETPYLLVEFSDYAISPTVNRNLEDLIAGGLVPVITHPERNPIVQRHPEMALAWAEMGCVVQVTANVLTGGWGNTARKTAHWLFKHEAVHVLASDAHDLKHRPPLLGEGRKAAAHLCGEEISSALVDANPRAIVSGQPLPYFPQPVP
jgi:protein-tyrosine phosphatase